MARWTDLADWQGETVNQGGSMGKIRMLVVHIEQGTNAGSIAWCKNPASKVSAHFFNPKQGRLVQLVDTSRVAWGEVDFNGVAISVEHEGNSGDSLTPSQIENDAQLLARAHQVYGIPLVVLNDPSGSGVIGHGLLGAAGGGHFDCPGPPVLAQRSAIVARAAQILGTTAPVPKPLPSTTPVLEDDLMPVFASGEIPSGFAYDGTATDASRVHMVLVPPANLGAAGWGDVWFSVGSDFGTPTVRVAAYVHAVGWVVKDNVTIPSAGDRVNPFAGPLPTGVQKISIGRRKANAADVDNVPLGWLVEAAHR
jgi:hypothetical protein